MNTFNRVALSVSKELAHHLAASDKDSEWQRVNSYIADVLKDAHVLYAKLARLQGDFAGVNLEELEKISEHVLDIGGKLSAFSKAFYEGRVEMALEGAYGEAPQAYNRPAPSPAPVQTAPEPQTVEKAEPVEDSEGLDIEFDYEAKEEPEAESKKQSKD